ncbi:melanocyte protein PMEL-like, partial [Fukomys damarensis]|uniref:melanocyte protein PMEL-like n=1 Tax=Fukomys damarensis TaxID=885580 RepID=UPI00053FC0E7
MEAPADLGSVEALLLGSWMAIFSLCPHMAEGTRELSGVSIRTLILSSAKGPPPNTITLVSILACKIERTQYSVYRRVVWFCFCYVLTFSMVNILLEGILEINIIQIADVLSPELQPDNSLMDFTVTCEGTIPTEVCTIISDPTCQLAQDMVCNSVDMDDTCLVTVRRAFKGSGMYCVNFTLGDNASLALTSTLVSIAGKGEFCFMVLRALHIAGRVCPLIEAIDGFASMLNFISVQNSYWHENPAAKLLREV